MIFVALAVAWAVYLIPKALRHHEIDRVSRSVESFSDRVRVLARREPVSASQASLVVSSSGTTVAVAAAVEAEDVERRGGRGKRRAGRGADRARSPSGPRPAPPSADAGCSA